MKKLLCMFLCVMLVVTMMPAMAWAMETTPQEGGGDGDQTPETVAPHMHFVPIIKLADGKQNIVKTNTYRDETEGVASENQSIYEGYIGYATGEPEEKGLVLTFIEPSMLKIVDESGKDAGYAINGEGYWLNIVISEPGKYFVEYTGDDMQLDPIVIIANDAEGEGDGENDDNNDDGTVTEPNRWALVFSDKAPDEYVAPTTYEALKDAKALLVRKNGITEVYAYAIGLYREKDSSGNSVYTVLNIVEPFIAENFRKDYIGEDDGDGITIIKLGDEENSNYYRITSDTEAQSGYVEGENHYDIFPIVEGYDFMNSEIILYDENEGGGEDDYNPESIFWIEASEAPATLPVDLTNWNDYFEGIVGSEMTVKFAVKLPDGSTHYLNHDDGIVVHDQHSELAEISPVTNEEGADNQTFKLKLKVPGQFRMYTNIYNTDYQIEGEIYEGISSEFNKFYGYIKSGNAYLRMNNVINDEDEGTGIPEFYRQGTNPDEFYILAPKGSAEATLSVFEVEGFENNKVGDIAGDLGKVDIEAFNGIAVDEVTDDPYCNEYDIWKLTVGGAFDMAKVGITVSTVENYTYYLWVLGEEYRCAEVDFYYGDIFAVPELKNWDSVGALRDDCRYDMFEHAEINLNMSLAPTENSFYVLHRNSIEDNIDLTQLYAYVLHNGSSGSIPNGSRFEKKLNVNEVFELSNEGTIDVGGKVYNVTKFTLQKYLGHNYLFLEIGDPDGDYMRAKITFGMNVYFEGANEGILAVNHTDNVTEQLFYPGSETYAFEVVKDEDGKIISAYFGNPFAIFDDYGQGRQCNLAIDLMRPDYEHNKHKGQGYVISSVTTTDGETCSWEGNRIFLNYLIDPENPDEVLDTYSELISKDGAGWHGPMLGTGGLVAIQTIHRFAGVGIDGIGWSNSTTFRNFVVDGGYIPEVFGAYTGYEIYFDMDKASEPCSITIKVEAPNNFKGSNKPEFFGRTDIELEAIEKPDSEYNKNEYEENVKLFHGEDVELKKVYNMTPLDAETKEAYEIEGTGQVCITISEGELDGLDLENYTVVYFNEDDVPIEMETTYVEDQGLVFTTGHFSTYAVIGTAKEDSGDSGDDSGNSGDSGNQGGTSGGYIPPAPSTPKDEVTNQTGTTTTAPTTNAELSQSTTSKGNETTTTVDQTIADKIVENAVANKSEEVVIDATVKTEAADHSTKAATVEVPTETLAQIAEKTDADVTIKTDVAEIKLDTEALAAVVEQAEGKSVSVVAEKVKADAKEIRVELKVVCSEGKTISDFKGGNISVTVEAPKGKKDVVCVYIDEQGHWHTVPGQLNADGTYTFTTGHFSTYAIVDAEHAADTIAAQKEAVKAVQLKLRSANAKTSKGKKAIKLTISEVTKTGIDFDGHVIYRSTKKTSGFKKIYTTKTGTYFNTSAKKGVKYYYKAKGFVTIDGEKVYTGWSKKAIRTAK